MTEEEVRNFIRDDLILLPEKPKQQRLMTLKKAGDVINVYKTCDVITTVPENIVEKSRVPVQSNDVVVLPGDELRRIVREAQIENAKFVPSTEGLPTSVSAKTDPKIVRKPRWYNRLLGKKQSEYVLNQHLKNHNIGRLLERKDQSHTMTVPDNLVNKSQLNYLIIHKFSAYTNRNECLEHMRKLSQKYLANEKIKFESFTPMELNVYLATIQKATDESFTRFMYAEESMDKGRHRKPVFARTNQYFQ
jgi:hypothetical protein